MQGIILFLLVADRFWPYAILGAVALLCLWKNKKGGNDEL